VNYLIPCRFSDPRNRCFPQVFPYCRPGCLWPQVGDPHLLGFCCRPTHVVHSVVQWSLISSLRYCTPLLCHITPRPPHTDVDTQALRVSGLCKADSFSVLSGPMNATIQLLVFLMVVLADADGIEIMHNSWQLCV